MNFFKKQEKNDTSFSVSFPIHVDPNINVNIDEFHLMDISEAPPVCQAGPSALHREGSGTQKPLIQGLPPSLLSCVPPTPPNTCSGQGTPVSLWGDSGGPLPNTA